MSHLTHLRTFLEAYRTKSFSRAADHLGITQPAASMHVQALEALVGKPLFQRLPRGVEPTEAADELARSVAPFLDGLENKIASLRPGLIKGGTVHLVGPSDFLHALVAARLAPLMDEGFTLRFHTGAKKRIYEMLEAKQTDFAITASMPNEQSHGYAHLLTERLLLVYAPSLLDRLGKDPNQAQLKQVPLIAFDEDLALVRPLWTSMFQVAPQLQAALTIPDLRIIKELVLGGHGWSVLPDYQCADAIADGRLISPTPPSEAPVNVLYLVWSKSVMKSPSLLYVRDYLLAAFSASRRRPAPM
ncbi:LysR family transcriptional regulator [Pseudomonas sp. TH49]|uniref:LysR family transcriptional regulator n=1 Tax=Pseudomonas sp. TH49 TaxID=2796413 RepID=UPI001913601E|nr:LysR family transcriptional regulator [Pseudomonas sp. TH49]MBK5344406.1 LysR family transcriptional regulator [Pseudomonas sp. TH49]